MMRACRLSNDIWQDQQGQDLIEYALLAGMFALAIGAVLPGAAQAMRAVYETVDELLGRYA